MEDTTLLPAVKYSCLRSVGPGTIGLPGSVPLPEMASTENKTYDARVGEALAEIRRRRAWMNAVLLTSIPLGFLLGMLAAMIGERSPLWLTLFVGVWVAISAFFVMRVASVRCPFCGERFFERNPFPNLWARRCRNCNVPLSSPAP